MILAWPQIILTAIVTVLICYGLHSLDIDRIESKDAKTLASQMQFDIKQCESQKQITSKSEKAYEDAIAQRDADLNKLRNRPAKIVYITKPTSSGDGTNKLDKPSNGNGGVASGDLLNFAGECETDRAKVVTLQGFILEERK